MEYFPHGEIGTRVFFSPGAEEALELTEDPLTRILVKQIAVSEAVKRGQECITESIVMALRQALEEYFRQTISPITPSVPDPNLSWQ